MSIEYRPGLAAEIIRLHAVYYQKHWNFDLKFEAKIAQELGSFLLGFRADQDFMRPVWLEDGRLAATITIAGPQADETFAHLRWFIVDEAHVGKGYGRQLMCEAMNFVTDRQYGAVFLTTFAGLDAARHLYESHGFQLVSQSDDDQWSGTVNEQRFEWRAEETPPTEGQTA